MKRKKLYEVRAVDIYSSQRLFHLEEAYSAKQAMFFFQKLFGFHFVGFDIREVPDPNRSPDPEQLSLF